MANRVREVCNKKLNPSVSFYSNTIILIHVFSSFLKSSRPSDPTTLDFELDEEFINRIHDGFLKGDVSVGQRRHLIFATHAQLQLLGKLSS